MRRYASDSRARLLRRAVEKLPPRQPKVASEGVAAPESEHQTPAWIRRCVASYLHGGETKRKKAPEGLDRDDVSQAFAICTAQYQKFDSPEARDAKALKGKKAKTRAAQYQKLLAKVRKGPKRAKTG